MKFELIDKSRAKFTFEVTPHEFEHAIEHAYQHIQADVEIKGFRKGHVPQNVYENKFGVESLYEEALNHALGHLFDQALAEPSLVIVSEPQNIDVDVKTISKTNPFEVSFEVDLKPEVKLGKYKGLEAQKIDTKVTDEQIDAEVDALLSEDATLEPKDGDVLEKGDTAVFDFDGSVDGVAFEGGKAENYSLKIGSGQFIPGFEEGMIGLKVGAEHDVKVTFPEGYQAEHLAGKDAVFKVKLHEIKTTKKAELNDEWVVGLNKEGVKTVSELKASILSELQKGRDEQAKKDFTDALVNQAVDNAEVVIPRSMIDREIKNFVERVTQQAKQYQLELDMFLSLSGLTREQFDEQAETQASRNILQSLVIEAIAVEEKLDASSEELAKRYDELSAHYGMPVEEIKKYVNDTVVKNDVTFEKAIELIVASAVAK